ncbi:hypothetical protein [Natronomonas amylolytica]|uniref:hypothetical protein n=1 Tax=Natronomonas amylolytica TaxID=3108498 RepID=UPI00300BB6E1
MSVFDRISAGISAARNELPLPRSAPQSDEYHLTAAIKWLCHTQDATTNGGSAASYNLVLGWEDAYPETTGYIIPTLFEFSSTRGVSEITDRAIRMADWLCTVQHSSGYFPAGTGRQGDPSVFNTGQIVFGLVSAYQETGDKRYKLATKEACNWLIDQQTHKGYWDNYDYNDEVHSYSTRIAWALLEGATIVPERAEVFREAARRNYRWAIQLQRANGWFDKSGFEAGSTPYLHTIAYTVRGLLEGGIALEEREMLDAATHTADKLLSIQQSNGVLKGAYDSSWSPAWYYCLTGNAQMAVIWLHLFERTGEVKYLRTARETLDFLKERQVLNGPAGVRGGLAGSYPLFGPYMFFRFPNWATKFFVDALLLSERHDTDGVS